MNVLPTTKVVGKEYGLFFLQFNSVLFFFVFFATRRIQWQNNSSYSSSIRRYSVTLYTTKVILWMSQCLQTSYLIKKKKKTYTDNCWTNMVSICSLSKTFSFGTGKKGGVLYCQPFYTPNSFYISFSKFSSFVYASLLYFFSISGRWGFIYITRAVILKFRLSFFSFLCFELIKTFPTWFSYLLKKIICFFFPKYLTSVFFFSSSYTHS